jgi:ADP-ribose pyrophosphatase YjhB (NUDIX family)
MLAEPARLRVVAALALGATTADDVATLSGLDQREIAAALRRLQSAGLVSTEKGELRLHEELFKQTARASAPDPLPDAALSDDPATAAVLRAFVRNGRIVSFPIARAKRRLLLEHVAGGFEPGVRYPERQVNDVLRAWHEDYAALRRYLVDELLLARGDGVYWRIGGFVDTARAPAVATRRRQRVAAYGLVYDHEGRALLTHLCRSVHRGRWTLPGGGLDFGERPRDTVVREVREETGLDVRVEELLDADAELVRYAGDAGEQIEAHPIRLLFRVTVVGGTLGVLEVDGSTDDVAWWAPGELSDDQLTPVARRVLRSGRLNG